MSGISFIHISDVRLGAAPDSEAPWSAERAGEIYDTFEMIIEEANRRRVDFLFISGNLFDHMPDGAELDRVNESFMKLQTAAVIYAAGSADSLSASSAVTSYPFAPHVYIPGADFPLPVKADDPRYAQHSPLSTRALDCISFVNKSADIYGASFFGRNAGRIEPGDIKPGNPDVINIILACEDKHRRLPINLTSAKGQGFDYAALGGRDKYKAAINGFALYPGSPEALCPDSTGRHGYIYGRFDNGSLKLDFVPVSKREYKTISYPVNNFTDDYDMRHDLKRLLTLEGRENIYTINISRNDGCEKSFELADSLHDFRILKINGETFVRTDYSEYYRANRSNRFGKLIEHMENSDLDARESSKLAVDTIIEISGVYKRSSKRLSRNTYLDAKKQAVMLLSSRCSAYENSDAMKAYTAARKQYESSPDVLDELNSVWAAERRTELEIKTARARLEELPRQRRRRKMISAMHMAVAFLLTVIAVSCLFAPSVLSRQTPSVFGGMMSAVLALSAAIAVLACCIVYYISKHSGKRKADAFSGKATQNGTENLRRELERLEQNRAELHQKRTALQELDGRRRDIRQQMTLREEELESVRYRLKLMKSAVNVLSIF